MRGVAEKMGKWGGIGGTGRASIDKFIDELPVALEALDPSRGDSDDVSSVPMNSLFSKVYRLAIKDFPIYDSRVGAALGLCVQRFLNDSQCSILPPSLTFGWAPGRVRSDGSSPLRNSSTAALTFPRLAGKGVHARSNLMAAWLFEELSALPCFDKCPEAWRTDAVQSAFFIIGYDLSPAA